MSENEQKTLKETPKKTAFKVAFFDALEMIFLRGYVEFEEAVGKIQSDYNLTADELKEYLKMYLENQ